MLESFSVLIGEALIYAIVKPIGVTSRWIAGGFCRPWSQLWNDYPRLNYPVGAFILIGIIAIVGLAKMVEAIT